MIDDKLSSIIILEVNISVAHLQVHNTIEVTNPSTLSSIKK